jgi:hypothetical protein
MTMRRLVFARTAWPSREAAVATVLVRAALYGFELRVVRTVAHAVENRLCADLRCREASCRGRVVLVYCFGAVAIDAQRSQLEHSCVRAAAARAPRPALRAILHAVGATAATSRGRLAQLLARWRLTVSRATLTRLRKDMATAAPLLARRMRREVPSAGALLNQK